MKIVVVNTSTVPVERGGYIFAPRKEKTVTVTASVYAEIRACQVLQIFEPGLKCSQPGCGFVAVNEKSLRFHRKRFHRRAAEEKGETASERKALL